MRRGAVIVLLAACDSSPAQNDAGLDVDVIEAAADVADESVIDAAQEADTGDEDAYVIPCGIGSVWTQDVPDHLACTGLYSNFTNKVVDTAAVAYTPGVILWSDGATKQRWVYLPPNSKIDTSNMDEWVFPVGTKVWKEFQISNKRIETRLYTKTSAQTWLWATYQWTSDETDAVRNDAGATNIVGSYEIPKHADCDKCHVGRGDKLLGLEAIALSLSSAQGATLDWLAKNGKLTASPTSTTASLPEDVTGKAAAALGSLHIGCGVSCHNQNPSSLGNSSGVYMRLPAAAVLAGTATVTTLDTYTTTVNMTPTSAQYSTYAGQGYKRILPGDASKTLLVAITNMRGAGQMPPIVTHVVDTTSVQALTDWVNAL
jgi:hypothetical protein